MSRKKRSKILSLSMTGFGFVALSTSVMAIFMPLLSDYGVWFALILATIHALLGGILLPILTIITCCINIFFLSPISSMGMSSIIITTFLFVMTGFGVKHAFNSKLTNVL